MTIPVIVVNWNGYDDTTECIASIIQSDYLDFKVYLVDNGSANNEGIRLRDDWNSENRVEVRILPENLGFARANNIILNELLQESYSVVFLLNNDTIIDKNCLARLIQAQQESGANMVSAKILNYYHREIIDNLGHQMLNTGEVVPIGHGQSANKYQHSFQNFGACAGAALYSLEMIRDIGVFDEYFSTGYEDAELGVRAIVSGYHGIYAPDAKVYHKMGQSIKKVFNHDYALMIQTCIWYTYLKLMPPGVIVLSLPFIIVKMILLSVINIFFLRWHYLRMQWQAIFHTLNSYQEIMKKRHDFHANHRVISSISILRKQRFFLLFDLKRFYHIFIRGNKSAVDSYGGR
ncbi:MAG: glycosyltransferase family 2 protein [Saprospiraceae bacterium]|nr:glycosyltransferase family 2 protein [Saprospiraceae bacterium]